MMKNFKLNEDFPVYINRVFTLEELVEFANDYSGAFSIRSRLYKDVQIRQMFMYLARQHGYSYEAIGHATGYNHPTCILAMNRVEDNLYVRDSKFLKTFNIIIINFNEHLKEKGNEYLDTIVKRNRSDSQSVISDMVSGY